MEATNSTKRAGSTAHEPDTTGAFGDCADCGVRHALPEGRARAHALQVMQEFERLQRLDYLASEGQADPKLAFEHLFAKRGNMFGVLECVDPDGHALYLRAFSSLTDGIRKIDGWVPPILSAELYEGVILPVQREIKSLTAAMRRLEDSGESTSEIERRRRRASQGLWDRMCSEYEFQNFRGETRSLEEAVLPGAPITGGMGECCAPKLLNHAARNGLRPVGIAEFYWGRSPLESEPIEKRGSRAASRRARSARVRAAKQRRVCGEFYPSCEARCRPILGFMLCGLDG